MPPAPTTPAGRPGPAIPWYLWCAALAVTSAYVGGYWDISWHRSIGRDSFWSPPHIAIYACGVLAGLVLGLSDLHDDVRTARAAARRERPHLGIPRSARRLHLGLGRRRDARVGAVRRLVAQRLRARRPHHQPAAHGARRRVLRHRVRHGHADAGVHEPRRTAVKRRAACRPLQRLFLYVGGMAVCESLLLKLEYISRPRCTARSSTSSSLFGTLGIVTALAIASRHRWACTIMTGVYTAFGLAFLWILPLFPAEPKLGPVYHQVTHFIPWEFPLLVIVPALVTDLILQRTDAWRPLARAPLIGLAFLATFIAAQWPFANFLMTPLARNWLFGTTYLDFSTPPTSLYARFQFVPPQTLRGLLARHADGRSPSPVS